jgi:hypothetical protein
VPDENYPVCFNLLAYGLQIFDRTLDGVVSDPREEVGKATSRLVKKIYTKPVCR